MSCFQPASPRLQPADERTITNAAGCGSAGTYNIKQPNLASELGDLKAQTIIESGCDMVTAGNSGCLVQIRKHLASNNENRIEVLHTIEIVDLALPE